MLSIGTILTPQVHIINGLQPPPQHAAVHLHQPRHPEAAPGGCAALRRAALRCSEGMESCARRLFACSASVCLRSPA